MIICYANIKEIWSIEWSQHNRKSTSVVWLVVSADQNGQFDWVERFCVPLAICYPASEALICNKSFLLPDMGVSSFSLSCWVNVTIGKGKCSKRVTQHNGCSCNIHEVSTTGCSVFFFFWRPKFFYGNHFTIEGRQKATFWKSELGALCFFRPTLNILIFQQILGWR